MAIEQNDYETFTILYNSNIDIFYLVGFIYKFNRINFLEYIINDLKKKEDYIFSLNYGLYVAFENGYLNLFIYLGDRGAILDETYFTKAILNNRVDFAKYIMSKIKIGRNFVFFDNKYSFEILDFLLTNDFVISLDNRYV